MSLWRSKRASWRYYAKLAYAKDLRIHRFVFWRVGPRWTFGRQPRLCWKMHQRSSSPRRVVGWASLRKRTYTLPFATFPEHKLALSLWTRTILLQHFCRSCDSWIQGAQIIHCLWVLTGTCNPTAMVECQPYRTSRGEH